jgi:DNA polymerase III subunit gamma/tau
MSETLYRKYRPQKFSEIIGQTHIVQTLSNSIKNNRIGQAYLLTGPRGTGKTTIARVFAKAVSCMKRDGFEPCQKCEICKNIAEGRALDIIEIDAASNTGVDNIRELRETVKLPPTQAKYKVYIIDEVHMLSTGAFNALLKTLEEPPAHVIFILATTEIHKVPETIISRCQRFDFSRLTLEQIVKKLSGIAQNEGVKIEKNALEMIAVASEGGMRDAESLLAQIIALEDKNITSKEVEEILGAGRLESVRELAHLVFDKKTAEALVLVNRLSEEGTNLEVFQKSLLNYLRQLMIASVSPDLSSLFSLELTKEQIKELETEAKDYSTKTILAMIENLIETQKNVRSSFIPQLPLEMAIIKSGSLADYAEVPNNVSVSAEKISSNKKPANPKAEPAPIKEEPVAVETPSKKEAYNEVDILQIKDNWGNILKATRPHNHSLMALLSNCEPIRIEDGKILIATKYSFYKDKLNGKSIRPIIEEVIDKILNSRVSVRFVTEEEAGVKISGPQQTVNNPESKGSGSLLDEAMKLMGGKIVE